MRESNEVSFGAFSPCIRKPSLRSTLIALFLVLASACVAAAASPKQKGTGGEREDLNENLCRSSFDNVQNGQAESERLPICDGNLLHVEGQEPTATGINSLKSDERHEIVGDVDVDDLSLRKARINQRNAHQLELDFMPEHANRARNNAEAKNGGLAPRVVGFDQYGNRYTSMNEVFRAGFGADTEKKLSPPPHSPENKAKGEAVSADASNLQERPKGRDKDSAADNTVGDGSEKKDESNSWKVNDIYDQTTGFYGKVHSYWSAKAPTVFEVTGVSDEYSKADLDETNAFLKLLETNEYDPMSRDNFGGRNKHLDFTKITIGSGRALDCGSGIGRIAEHVLAPRFDVIDLVEPAAHLLAKAVDTIKAKGKLGKAFATSLELLDLPEVPTYDFINMQWVAMYLTDNDLIDFLRRAKVALRNGTTRRALTPEEATKRRLARAEAEVGSLPQMRRRLAALKRRGRGVLSDAEAAEYDRLEDDIERAELKQKKENKKNTDVKSAIAGDVSEFEEVNTTGIIFMKEMMARGTSFKGDAMSGAIIRSRDHFLTIFKEAGLKVHHSTIDETSDKDGENYTPSYMFALR